MFQSSVLQMINIVVTFQLISVLFTLLFKYFFFFKVQCQSNSYKYYILYFVVISDLTLCTVQATECVFGLAYCTKLFRNSVNKKKNWEKNVELDKRFTYSNLNIFWGPWFHFMKQSRALWNSHSGLSVQFLTEQQHPSLTYLRGLMQAWETVTVLD